MLPQTLEARYQQCLQGIYSLTHSAVFLFFICGCVLFCSVLSFYAASSHLLILPTFHQMMAALPFLYVLSSNSQNTRDALTTACHPSPLRHSDCHESTWHRIVTVFCLSLRSKEFLSLCCNTELRRKNDNFLFYGML